jgi:hypothetical protein
MCAGVVARAWATTLAVSCFLALNGSACRQIVGFDEPKSDAGDHVARALPLLPFVPEKDYAETCERCALDSCSSERDACLADARCLEILRCREQCRDPVCIARCGSFAYLTSAGSVLAHESPLFQNYNDCVSFGRCASECHTGLNWACVEQKPYRWPARPRLAEDSRIDFRVEVIECGSWLGVPSQITAYWGSQDLLASARGSSWGQAELVLPVSETIDGYLEIEPSVPGLGHQIFQTGPVFRATLLSACVFPAGLKPLTPEPGSAAVGFYIFDCLGVNASGVTFELDGAEGTSFYGSSNGEVSTNAQRTELHGFGGFANLRSPPDAVSVVAKRGGTIVARKLVRVRQDWLTVALLWPRSEDD